MKGMGIGSILGLLAAGIAGAMGSGRTGFGRDRYTRGSTRTRLKQQKDGLPRGFPGAKLMRKAIRRQITTNNKNIYFIDGRH